MKKRILSTLAILLFSIAAYAQCFTPVWSEPSHDPMFIYVSMASLYGTNLQVGDEIGVFEREECVGVGVLTEELTGEPVYLVIETSRERRDNPGFRPGRTITYRFCSEGEVANPLVIPSYISNGPTFVENDSCIVELRAINTAPLVTSIPDTVTLEDELYTSSMSAEDIDGDSLLYSAPLLPSWLSFNDTTQVLSGTPANPDVGSHTVILSVSDGIVTIDSTFSIRVINFNDAPAFTFEADTMALEDSLYSLTITASDVDVRDSLIYSASHLPPWLIFNDTTHVLSGTPDNDAVGDHSINIRVNDGTLNVDTSFVIHVSNANDAPIFTFDPDTMAIEDVPYSLTITASDVDIGDTLIFMTPSLPPWLSFNDTTGMISGTPTNDDVGDDTLTLRVNDGMVDVDSTFIIHVSNVNDAPTFTFLTDTVALEDALYSFTVTAEDIDGDTLSFSSLELPDWLSFNDTSNVVSGTPDNEDIGDYFISLRIYDGIVDVDTSFVVHVLNVNDAPAFTSIQDSTGLQGALYTYSVTAEDEDGDTLNFSAPVLPIWLSFDSITNVLSGIPGNSHVGDNSVVLRVTDGSVDVIQIFVIAVENVNDPPVVTSVPLTEARPGLAYFYTITAEDIDGDSLSYTALVLPGWLTFNTTTHILSATPGEGDVGDQHLTIRVSDGSLYVDHTFIVTVDYGNHAPSFISYPPTAAVLGNTYEYVLSAQDIDSDSLDYSAPQLPGWLTFFPEKNMISGIPGSSDLGRHDVVLRVCDGTVSADQSFPIFVEGVNNPPSFTSTPLIAVPAGDLYVYIAEAEDADGDELSYSAITLPSWLHFDVQTQNLHGTPTNEHVGDHNVALRVTDGEGSENQNFVITVDFVYGTKEVSSGENILIYPNPSDGRFFIELSKEFEEEIILEILDPMGKVLVQKEFPPYFLISEAFSLEDQPGGIYFIRVYSSTFQTLEKLIMH